MKIIICKFGNNLTRSDKHDYMVDVFIDIMDRCYGIDVLGQDIIYGKNGKPYIKNNTKYFNFSYSGELGVIGISDRELGIDIEKVKKYDERVVKKVYSREEEEFIRNSKDRDYEFTKLWTYKEAFVKYKGVGIDNSFDKLNFINNGSYMYDKLIKTISYSDYVITVCSDDLEVEVIYEK